MVFKNCFTSVFSALYVYTGYGEIIDPPPYTYKKIVYFISAMDDIALLLMCAYEIIQVPTDSVITLLGLLIFEEKN